MSTRAFQIWLGITLLLTIMLAPFLARGDQAVRQRKIYNAQVISGLSDSERNRLLQNETQFRAASPAVQESLRNFQAAMEKDRQNGGELAQVMNQYDAWIRTIKRPQREQLASTTSPQERIALMKEIVRNQREWSTHRSLPFLGSGPGGDRPHTEMPPLLDEKSFHAVMNALQEAAQTRLKPGQKEELSKLSGLKQNFRLLQFLKENGTGLTPKPLLEEPPSEFKTVVEQIPQLVNDQRIRDFILTRPASADGEAPVRRLATPETRLVALVYQSSLVELFKLRRTSHQQVEDSRLREYLNQLPLDRQYELLSLEASDFQNELRNQYLDKEGLSGLPGMQDFRELFGWGFMRGGMGGPDRGPPGFRGDRDRDNRSPRGPGGLR